MAPRMLCTDCETTARPDTRLPGSDLGEMLGWLCFALPGWLYCLWRHALRVKVCPVCAGRELVREARARAEREASATPSPLAPPRVENLRGPVRWPHPWRLPRQRLRRGAPLVLLCWAWGALELARLGLAEPATPPAAAPLLAALAALWVLCEARRFRRARTRREACRAWDTRGRPLSVELVGGA